MHDSVNEQHVSARGCPICASAKNTELFEQHFSLMSYGSLLKGYSVVICQNCGFGYADHIPEQDVFDGHYREMSKYEYQDSGGHESPYDLKRFRSIAELLTSYLSDKDSSILDIGCSTGKLLSLFKERGYHNAYGLDPSPVCAATAKRLYDIQVSNISISELENHGKQFTCLILSGVLEHVRDLRSFMASIRMLTTSDGLLFIEVPDATRFVEWPDAPFQEFSTEHINFFSALSLDNLMMHHGFEKETSQDNIREQNYKIIMPVVTALYKKTSRAKPPAFVYDDTTESALTAYISQSQQIENRIHEIIDTLVANKTPIIVWGVGTHTLRLLATSQLSKANIQAFVDSNPRYHGKQLNGLGIISPDNLRDRRESILISSGVFQHVIEKQIKNDLKLKNIIIKLYKG